MNNSKPPLTPRKYDFLHIIYIFLIILFLNLAPQKKQIDDQLWWLQPGMQQGRMTEKFEKGPIERFRRNIPDHFRMAPPKI